MFLSPLPTNPWDITGSKKDAASLNLKEGDRIVLKSEAAEYAGICRVGPLHPHTVQVFWPEANVLLSRRIDPASREPDYNTTVTIHKNQ